MFQQPMLTLLLLVKVAPIWTLSSSSWDESIRADVFRSPALKLAFIHGSPPPSSLSSSLSDYTEISIAKSTCLVPNSWSKNDEMKSDNEEEKKEEESDETLLKAGLAAMSRMSCLFYVRLSRFHTFDVFNAMTDLWLLDVRILYLVIGPSVSRSRR